MTGYIGIGGTAKKVKNIYIGVGGVAKQVKKGYIGVGGVAKLWYRSKKELSYYGTATALSVARSWLAGASNSNYAIFAGGTKGDQTGSFLNKSIIGLNTVEAYNSNLIQSLPGTLRQAVYYLMSGNVGDYAVFAGGTISEGMSSPCTDKIDAYNSTLTKTTSASLSSTRTYGGSANAGDYLIFAGGSPDYSVQQFYYTAAVDAYNSALVLTSPSSLTQAKWGVKGASVGNYALFAGGVYSNSGNAANSYVVTAYNSSLVRSTAASDTTVALGTTGAGASVGNYALFAAGSTSYNNVIAYDTLLIRSTPTGLSEARNRISGNSISEYALFAGGFLGSTSSVSSVVDAYDESLVRTLPNGLSQGRAVVASSSIGDYSLFAGGTLMDDSNVSLTKITYCNTVDVYQSK